MHAIIAINLDVLVKRENFFRSVIEIVPHVMSLSILNTPLNMYNLPEKIQQQNVIVFSWFRIDKIPSQSLSKCNHFASNRHKSFFNASTSALYEIVEYHTESKYF